MSQLDQVVIVGGGHTAASAARALRKGGYDRSVVVIGDEPHPPYQRPPLSKEFLQGKAGHDELWSGDPDWFAENDVELRTGVTAARIDGDTLAVELADGESVPADAVILATGGRVRRLPDAEGERVFYLRTIEDSLRIQEHIGAGKHLIVVGAGFIGSEVAASARVLGTDVTMIEALEHPLERVLGHDMGAICGEIHVDEGVDLRCGVTVDSIHETSGGVVIRTGDGKAIEGDAVVVGIGIIPNVEIAQASEITVGNGIRVDEFCRTSMEGVYAAGDVANHYHPLFDRRMRVEHFDNAFRQGTAAAKNILAERVVDRVRYADPHWFWSDQYDESLQYVGHAENWDEVLVRGSIHDRDFLAFYMKDGLLDAAFGVNRGAEIMVVKTLIGARNYLDIQALIDDDIDLTDLLIEEEPEEEEDDAVAAVGADGGYHLVGRSGKVPEGIVRRFVVEGVEIAIARSEGQAYAMDNYCTHLACHLSSGKVEDGGMVCLCHGSIFDLATGEPVNPPASKPVKTYPLKEEDGQIYVAIE